MADPKAPVIPTLDEIMQAYSTLGDLLGQHHAGMNPPMPEMQPQGANKLAPMLPPSMPMQPKRY